MYYRLCHSYQVRSKHTISENPAKGHYWKFDFSNAAPCLQARCNMRNERTVVCECVWDVIVEFLTLIFAPILLGHHYYYRRTRSYDDYHYHRRTRSYHDDRGTSRNYYRGHGRNNVRILSQLSLCFSSICYVLPFIPRLSNSELPQVPPQHKSGGRRLNCLKPQRLPIQLPRSSTCHRVGLHPSWVMEPALLKRSQIFL